jgi:hypothetical protein
MVALLFTLSLFEGVFSMGAFVALVVVCLGVAAALYKKERRAVAMVPLQQTQKVKPGVVAAFVVGGLILLAIIASN